MTQTEARGVALRLLIGLPLLIWLAWSQGAAIAQALAPAFRAVLGWTVSHLGTPRLEVVAQESLHVFAAQVAVGNIVLLKGQMLPPGSVLRASLPVYVALAPLLIVVTAALAWKGLTWRGRLLRLAISVPFMVLLELVDTPALLAIALHESVRGAGPASAMSPWVGWIHFMDGGGRYALAIGAALLVAEVHSLITRGLTRRIARKSAMAAAATTVTTVTTASVAASIEIQNIV